MGIAFENVPRDVFGSLEVVNVLNAARKSQPSIFIRKSVCNNTCIVFLWNGVCIVFSNK